MVYICRSEEVVDFSFWRLYLNAMDLNSQATFLSSVWLILGIVIFLGNIITTAIIWLRKTKQERSKFGLKCHAAYNLLGVDMGYSFHGLVLTLMSIVRLTKDGRISEGACDVLGFFQAFSFHFAAVGVLVLQTDKFYCLAKPFVYHAYSRSKSTVPLIVVICCIIYGTIIAVLPLTKLGNYSSKTTYTSCMLTWNQSGAFYVGLSLDVILFLLTIVIISGTLRQKLQLIQKRRKMRVATSHPNETIIFVLAVSSLFILCWTPNLVSIQITLFAFCKHCECEFYTFIRHNQEQLLKMQL